jgi:hypothetical protein
LLAVTATSKKPAASQDVATAQETAFRCVKVADAGFGADCRLHPVPFHLAADGPAPTASQNFGDVHDTPSRLADAGLGIACALQCDPFHTSPPLEPTASQKVIETHDTEFIAASDGTACMRHDLPFHRSATAGPGAPGLPPPHASQNVADVHDTALKSSNWAPAGLGACCSRQVVPFHVADSKAVPRVPRNEPTASQNREDVQDTELSLAESEPTGTGT